MQIVDQSPNLGISPAYNGEAKNPELAMPRTYDEIMFDIQNLQKEAQGALERERAEAIVRIRAEMARFGITLEEVSASAEVENPVVRRKPATAAGKASAAAPKTAASTEAAQLASASASADKGKLAIDILDKAGIDFRSKTPERNARRSPRVAATAAKQPARKAATRPTQAKKTRHV
ncbi:hypothetical protein PWR63_32475 [Paraburkholderia sp. A2WS-5]|uniref:hypothetical protein n=1 Tax=unclassified Paraburkholderia TaxID=2615204 RepID=UPI003B76D20B